MFICKKYEMESVFIDEENIPLTERDNDDSVYQDAEETFFSRDIQREATEAELRLRERSLEEKDGQINVLERSFYIKIPQ